MFWSFLLFTGLAASFSQLGASSAMINILSAGLQAALLVIVALAITLLWISHKKHSEQPENI